MAYTREARIVEVEWDPAKDTENRAKHGLSFEEASELFTSGRDYLEIFDAAHAEEEDRFISIGFARKGVIVVVWTERDEGRIRIISARHATRRDRRAYARYKEQHHGR